METELATEHPGFVVITAEIDVTPRAGDGCGPVRVLRCQAFRRQQRGCGRLGFDDPRAAKHHHGAVDACRPEIGVGAVEFQRQPAGACGVALQELGVLDGHTVARTV